MIPPCDRGAECALIWLSVAYCEGMHFRVEFGLSGFNAFFACDLLVFVCSVFQVVYRLCRALPPSGGTGIFAFA